jgi:hypothetical protein
MPDWQSSMQQTYEYYIVDPKSWKDVRLLDTVKSCSITRDSSLETLGSATIDLAELVGECYVRAYLITIQNGIKEKFPLGTFLLQTPSSTFNGKIRDVSVDAYTPLIELKENQPPLGFSVQKGTNVMTAAYNIFRDRQLLRAPVVKTSCTDQLYSHFVANTSDTWLTFMKDLISNAKYTFDLDELGRILFSPKQDIASMQPVWTYTDDNSSILYPELTMNHDMYGVPNAIDIVYTKGFYNEGTGKQEYYLTVTNDDPSSPTSTVNRGRVIRYREIDPNIAGGGTVATKKVVENYAASLLRTLSSLEYTITYTHGYCPVRVGDCIRLNYERAGLVGIKAKVISQTIKCEPGCPVTETAVFTTKLWEV